MNNLIIWHNTLRVACFRMACVVLCHKQQINVMTTKESILARLTEAVAGTDKDLFNDDELKDFADFYLDKWDENTSEDVVAESFVDFYWNTDKTCRRCSVCGKLFREGYCQNAGDKYYCSDECLREDFTEDEWKAECEENDQSYYTEWN